MIKKENIIKILLILLLIVTISFFHILTKYDYQSQINRVCIENSHGEAKEFYFTGSNYGLKCDDGTRYYIIETTKYNEREMGRDTK